LNNREIKLLFLFLFVSLFLFLSCSLNQKGRPIETAINRTEAFIIDHTCTDIKKNGDRYLMLDIRENHM